MKNPEPARPVCNGFLVQVGSPEATRRERDRLVRTVVRRTLGAGWRIAPLSKHSTFYQVTPLRAKPIPLATAWQRVHRLKRDRDVYAAEPSLVTAGLEPDPHSEHRQLTARERSRRGARPKSGGGDRHKSGSRHPEWSLVNARVDRAWALRPRAGGRRLGDGIVIGHPDTGYTLHPEIWNNPGGFQRVRSQTGYDFVDDKRFPVDPLASGQPSHGTKTASVIMSDAGPANQRGWVSGAAPLATLVPYRVIKSVIVMNFSNVARAIHRAVDNGCHLISMSLGGPLGSRALEEAVLRAVEHDVIVLAAAGNVWPWVVYPAKLDHVIAVAASNCEDKPWGSSASGDAVDVSAPGESVWRAETLGPGTTYGINRGNGTSFAVATAAGVTALWLAHHGRERLIRHFGAGHLAAAYKELLVTRGVRRPSGWNTERFGSGIIDAERLLSAPLPERAPARGTAAGPKRGRARRTRSRVFADLMDFVPGASPTRVRASLSRVLGVSDAGLDAVLADVGDEIVFHAGTDRSFREALQGGGARPKSRARAARPRRAAPRHSSPELRKRIREEG